MYNYLVFVHSHEGLGGEQTDYVRGLFNLECANEYFSERVNHLSGCDDCHVWMIDTKDAKIIREY